MELGNLVFIGLVILQFILGIKDFSLGFAILGVTMLGVVYTIADKTVRGGDDDG